MQLSKHGGIVEAGETDLRHTLIMADFVGFEAVVPWPGHNDGPRRRRIVRIVRGPGTTDVGVMPPGRPQPEGRLASALLLARLWCGPDLSKPAQDGHLVRLPRLVLEERADIRQYSILMRESYDALADDYDWLFSDDDLRQGVAVNLPATARLLSSVPLGSAVLDAACGTGVDAALLARRGYRVCGADASSAMVGKARIRFDREGLTVTVVQAEWAKLPWTMTERFDVALCIGNSLVHARSRERMINALQSLAAVLRPKGRLVVDSRNWEKLHREQRTVVVHDRPIVRDGRRCIVMYAWEIPDAFDREHVAHLVFLFDDGEKLNPREHAVAFRPFTFEELRDRVRAAGLREFDSDFDPNADRYSVVLGK
ncbi:MAG: class I SAM-dependent methyltransferase [Actinobacteria bacterium]|nr:class I SAM-dependent methyltransferase [Actinomycetota bacterium]